MSKQLNFFALGKDFDFIHKTILNRIGEAFYFPARGTSDEMVSKKILKIDDFNEIFDITYLVPASLLDSVISVTKAMQQITKKLKTKTVKLPDDNRFFVFENARRFAKTFQPWPGKPGPNPFLESNN